ncbi:MAG: hypothetical protein MI810_21780 [Flavobacteriales bacterium]|nr:hypothetical protein [Flavobacteriales bacterium]
MKALLKYTLLSNFCFSLMSGLSLVLFSDEIGTLIEVRLSGALVYIGLGLLPFALFTIWVSQQKKNYQKWVKLIIYMDLSWVIGSCVILLFQPFTINATGNIIIGVVALIIGLFALLQKRGLS